jgi:hypothetical protein
MKSISFAEAGRLAGLEANSLTSFLREVRVVPWMRASFWATRDSP